MNISLTIVTGTLFGFTGCSTGSHGSSVGGSGSAGGSFQGSGSVNTSRD